MVRIIFQLLTVLALSCFSFSSWAQEQKPKNKYLDTRSDFEKTVDEAPQKAKEDQFKPETTYECQSGYGYMKKVKDAEQFRDCDPTQFEPRKKRR